MPTHAQSGPRFAAVPGGTLCYDIAGTGHPLVLIHGGLVDRHLWDDQVAAFARFYRVIRYDVRGYGDSALPTAPYAHHDDLRHLLRALAIERTYLLGLSMGGRIAIEFTLAHPERVDALIPVASGLDGYQWSEVVTQQQQEVDAAFARGAHAEVVELLTRIWTDGPQRQPQRVDASVRARVQEMTARLVARPVATVAAQPLEPAAPARLAEIHAPTLVIVGDQDVPDILAIADRLTRGIAGARRAVIPGAAHHLNMERPDEFNRIVLEFLASLTDTA